MNDAQRKAMEQTIKSVIEQSPPLPSHTKPCPLDFVHWALLMRDSYLAALRAQLDAPAEKVEQVAWLAPDGTIRNRLGARTFKEWAWGNEDFKPLFFAPPTAAQIAAQARAEAIEECVGICYQVERELGLPGDCAAAIRDLKSSAPTDTKPASQWVSVDERLPDGKSDVLVYCSDTREQFVAFHISEGMFQFALNLDGSRIACVPTHWRSLPADPISAPTEGEKG